MNPWIPDADTHQARRIGKTLEELGELTAVLGRISIQGMHAIDPASQKTNFQRLHEEMADVFAQLTICMHSFRMDETAIDNRFKEKMRQMIEWESHFKK